MSVASHPVTRPVWWPAVLRRFLGVEDLSARTLAPYAASLARLSAALNGVTERRLSETAYMRDARLRRAYQLYYVTVNFLKPIWALKELYPAGLPPGRDVFRVLDLGCGPGTGVAAMHAWLEDTKSERRIRIEGVDAVDANAGRYRELGALLSGVTRHAVECDARCGDAIRPATAEPVYDLVLAMNLLNEIPEARHAQFLARCGAALAGGGVLLLIEPALRETTRPLLRLRDHAVRSEWRVSVPCHRQDDCPALVDAKDWCHHDLAWERPPFIAVLDEAIGNIKKSLKFSCVALERGAEREAEPEARTSVDTEVGERLRVVSELFVEKGRSWCYCCGVSGRRLYQRNHRDRRDANAAFDTLVRYDTIAVADAEMRAHDVRITAESRVRIETRRADGPGAVEARPGSDAKQENNV